MRNPCLGVVAFAIWLSSGFAQGPVPIPGFPLTIRCNPAVPCIGGAVLVDLTGDGRQEIVVAGWEFMYVFRHDGSLLPGWPQAITRQYEIRYGPAVGDITGDGSLEILCITNWHTPVPNWDFDSTFLFAWSSNGQLVPGFPVSYGSAYHSPVLYDMTGDGKAEIIMVWADLGDEVPNRMTVLNGDGTMRPGWPQPIGTAPGVFLGGPAVGDVDGDRIPDVVFSIYGAVVGQASTVHAWDATTAQVKAGFPFTFPDGFDDTKDRLLLPPDSLGRRKILTYGSYWRLPSWEDSTLVVVLRHDGTPAPGWPQPMRGVINLTKFALGNLFGDGLRIALFDKPHNDMYIWNLDGQLIARWPTYPASSAYLLPAALEWPSPLMHIVRESNRNHNFSTGGPLMGAVLFERADGTVPPWSPLKVLGWTAFSPPIFGDINGDGIADMVIVAEDSRVQLQRAYVHAFTFPGVPFNRETFPWPMPGHDRWRTSQYGFIPPDSIVVKVDEVRLLPESIVLHQNYPNPFNPQTRITYELPHRSHVRLTVANILGQTVQVLVDEVRSAGRHHAWFDPAGRASGVSASGVYFYRLEAEGVRLVRKMILLR